MGGKIQSCISTLRLAPDIGAGESPPGLVLDPRRVVVAEELDCWLDPQHRSLKVRSDDGDIAILRHDVPSDGWKLTLSMPALGAAYACPRP